MKSFDSTASYIRICFLLLAGLLASAFAKSQSYTYQPFPVSNGFWSYRFYDGFGNPTSGFKAYSLAGDTLIATKMYKKLFEGSSYTGALRENNRIIYFVPDTSSLELVLYNFNLLKGDTIFYPYGGTQCHGDTVIVTSVDTVLTPISNLPASAWKHHLAINLSSGAGWLDGIGSGTYLLYPAAENCLSGGDKLQCMLGDSGLLFAYTANPCINSVLPKNSSVSDIYFSPNPFYLSSVLHVNQEFKNSDIKFFSSFGVLVKHYKISELETNFAGNEFKQGFYFYQLTTTRGKVFVGKLLVEQ